MAILIGVDVGGTFTDFAVSLPDEERVLLYKEPSTPGEPDRAILNGLNTLIGTEGLAPRRVELLAHGTTVGTNALIERRCGRIGLVTTAGFRDLLEIGRQTRPRMYDLHCDDPEPLVPRRLRFEVPERRLADGRVLEPLDETALDAVAAELRTAGVDGVVVFFLHSYKFPEHEQRARDRLRTQLPPHVHLVTSAEVFPEFREYERLSTTVLNAGLMTVMDDYLERFSSAVERLGIPAAPRISQSAGGLMSVEMARRLPISASLSGPAAGVVGAARRGAFAGIRDLITLDVGGTSTDVSLILNGSPGTARDRALAGFPLRIPLLDVNAVGAGGGSVAWIDRDGLMKVGPRSAGAHPGPACYGNGGEEATLTDANVLLGRLNPAGLLEQRMPIRAELSEDVVGTLSDALGLEVMETARGIVQVACANIVKAIRTVSVERGYDPAEFTLFAYGGAGPLHATEVARELGITRILVPPNPGVLCAEGLLASDLRKDFVNTALIALALRACAPVNAAWDEASGAAAQWFIEESIVPERQKLIWTADARYRGQNYEIAIVVDEDWFKPFDPEGCAALLEAFHQAHEQAYGFASPSEPVELVSLRVQAIGQLEKAEIPPWCPADLPRSEVTRRNVCFDDLVWMDTPVLTRACLAEGQVIEGPAVIEQMDSTTLVFPGDHAKVDRWGNLQMAVAEQAPIENRGV